MQAFGDDHTMAGVLLSLAALSLAVKDSAQATNLLLEAQVC